MVRASAWLIVFSVGMASAAEPPIRVALYIDKGTSDGKANVKKVIESMPEAKLENITAEDIRAGKLKGVQVLVVPGGTGGGQGKALEEKGRQEIRNYVKQGGKYLGICAGAYLATNDYEWSLNILNAKVADRKHWARGHGPVQIAFTDKGTELLKPKQKQSEIIYWQGPLLAPGDSKELPAFESLAKYETEIAENGAPVGVMKGTTAIATATFGQGHVLCFSPHPEKAEATYGLLTVAVKWLNERPAK